jgi:hypothetical protein
MANMTSTLEQDNSGDVNNANHKGSFTAWIHNNRVNLCFIAITLVYLFFELSFNAWLLNTVGGGGSEKDVSDLELYGRTLSGIAVALVAAQVLIHWKKEWIFPRLHGYFLNHIWRLIMLCVVIVVATYFTLNTVVNKYLIETSTASERKQFSSLLLLQQALVKGTADIKGLVNDNGTLFQSPEGKSFLAIFPYLVSSIDGIEKTIFDSKLEIIKLNVAEGIGIQKYFDGYKQAMSATHANWEKYNKAGDFDISDEISKQQNKAWDDYLKSLSKKGWTPNTIPADFDLDGEISKQQTKAWDEYVADLASHRWTPDNIPWLARGRVVSKVRHKIPVPGNWNPADKATFDSAVEQRVRATYAKKSHGKTYRGSVVAEVRKKIAVPANWNPSDKATFDNAVAQKVRGEYAKKGGGELRVRGKVIPKNLSFDAFVLHPAIQEELHDKLVFKFKDTEERWPHNIVVRPHYGSAEEFKNLAFTPVVDKIALEKAKELDEPADTFGTGGKNEKTGMTSARGAIIPSVALFFSLLGATGHTSKLIFLLVGLFKKKVPLRITEKTFDKLKLILILSPLLIIVPWILKQGMATVAGIFGAVVLIGLIFLSVKVIKQILGNNGDATKRIGAETFALILIPSVIVGVLLTHQNRVTETTLYKTVEHRLLESKSDQEALIPMPVKLKMLHVISVGQTYIYSTCESFRTVIWSK